MNYDNRFKDCKPSETIKHIKSILKSIDINTTETWHGSDGIYSVRVNIEGTCIGTNGKGSSKEFALASGYGELMERLENLLPFRLTDCFSHYTKGNEYEFTPLEIYTEGIVSDRRQKKWFDNAIPVEIQPELLKLEHRFKNTKGKITNIPFGNIQEKDEILIPLSMLDVIYGSNGMAAGNTFEEAFVQGLSEVIERYVCYKFLQGDLEAPDITRYVRENYKNIDEIIKTFENDKLQLSIKDMSIGENFPAVAVILYDKENLQYLVNFGVHPSLEISIERSITELFQGREVKSLDQMVKINSNIEIVKSDMNKYEIFKEGIGTYNPRLFIKKCDEEPKSIIWKNHYQSNKEMMSVLTKLVEDKGFEIYYSNNSYLGFPALHIVVPGMSEIASDDFKEFKSNLEYSRIQQIYRKIENANNDEISEFASFIDNKYSPLLSLDTLFLLPLDSNNDMANITKYMILMILYCSLEDYENAYKCSCKYIDMIEKEEHNIEAINYYKMVSAIFNCRCNNMTDEEIISSLSSFSDIEFITECINDLKRENVFMYLPRITCPNCEQCSISAQCHFDSEKELFGKILKCQKNYLGI